MKRNQGIEEYLNKLSAVPKINYSLWKATKRLTRPQTHHPPIRKQDRNWVRSEKEKAETFAVHFSKVFKPNPREITLEEEDRLLSDDITPDILDTSTRPFIINEVKAVIKYLNPKKALSYDLIINQILQTLPEMGIKYIT